MDLTKITTIFGELPKEAQDALKELPIGQVQVRGHLEWVDDSCPPWYGGAAYRQKPSRSFTEAFIDLPNGTIFQVGSRRYIKHLNIANAVALRQLEAPYQYCWYRDDKGGWRRVCDMEGLSPAELSANDITIVCRP